jgi:hypothetical protein
MEQPGYPGTIKASSLYEPVIEISAADDMDYMRGKGYSLLFIGHIPMIVAVGAIFRFGSRRGDKE